MVRVRKHIDAKVPNRSQVIKIIDHVIKEYSQRTDFQKMKEVDIYVTKNPVKVCKKIFSSAKLHRHGELRDWICESKPNFSFWEKGKVPVIMINGNEKIFKTKKLPLKKYFPSLDGIFKIFTYSSTIGLLPTLLILNTLGH